MVKLVPLFGRSTADGVDEVDMSTQPRADAESTEGLSTVQRARRSRVSKTPATAAAQAGAPASVLAERSVVGAVLANNTLYDVVLDVLRVEDFADPAAAAVFKGIENIIEGQADGLTTADPITLASLPTVGQLVSLESLQQWAESANTDPAVARTHAQVVYNAARERKLDAALVEAQGIAKSTGSVTERAESIQEALTIAGDVRTLPVRSIGAAAVAAISRLVERAQNGQTGVGLTTGFTDLDALTAGLHPGQLIIVAARPGIGKTAFAMSVGLATAAAGHATVMASMEMKAEELSTRALSIVSSVDSHALRIGALGESDWEDLVTAAEYLEKLPFDIVDMETVTLPALRNLCRRLKREERVDLLIVDYLQIMETTSTRNSTREQEVAALSRGLKKLAMVLSIPVIALSQLNRAVENRLNRRPQMSDLRESGALEQDADVIMFIHREGGDDGVQQLEETAEIIVEKQRAGPTGVVQVGYARSNTRFYNLTPASYGAEQVLSVA